MKKLFLIVSLFTICQLTAFGQQTFFEGQMDVFFNQDYYVPGDTAFFSVKLLSTQKDAWKGKQLLHLEVVSLKDSVLVEQYVRVANGFGSSHIIFPAKAKQEVYMIRIHIIAKTEPVLEWKNFISLKGVEVKSANTKNEYLLKGHSALVYISGLNDSFPHRQKIEAKVRITKDGRPLKGRFSVRVVNKKATNDQNPLSLVTEAKSVDKSNVMNSITWKGKLIDKKSGAPVPDSTHVFIYLQKNLVGYDFYTSNGEFNLPVFYDFYDDDIVFYLAEYKGNELVKVEMNINKEKVPHISFNEKSLNPTKNWYGIYKDKKYRVAKSYQSLETVNNRKSNESGWVEENYMEPDVSVNLANYLIFPTVEELIMEIVPVLKVRKTKDEFQLRMFLLQSLESGYMSTENPLLIIDGVMTKDIKQFFKLKPVDIISIKLVRKPAKLQSIGDLGKHGIVFVTTKSNAFWQKLSSGYPSVTGIRSKIDFEKSSSPAVQNLRMPDFRASLYWNPEIVLNNEGDGNFSFITPDDEDYFLVQINGITDEGYLINYEKGFSVSEKK